jgi:hypothetical protein
MSNNSFSPNNYAKNLWRLKIKEYSDIIASGKKLCFVWGSDKPFLYWDGRFYIVFQDIVDNCVNPFTQDQYQQGWYDELFYWTPDLPMLPIKQAHVIKRFLETVHDPVFYQASETQYGYNRHIQGYLTEHAVKLVIYPRWDPSTFISPGGKPFSTIYSQRDTWFLRGNIEQTRAYKNIIAHLQDSIDPYWLNDGQNILNSIKRSFSRKYYIEK